MQKINKAVTRALSIGVHRELSEVKKLAIQIATLDGYWSLVVISFYVIQALVARPLSHLLMHGGSLLVTIFGLWLISQRRYDFGRVLLHFIGLFEIFLSADSTPRMEWAEYFYFTSIVIPFVTFSFDEQWKGYLLSATAIVLLFLQQYLGTGHFMEIVEISPLDRNIGIGFVISFFVLVLGVGRRQLKLAQEEVTKQQNELVHQANLVALGEISASIAHEINNPLQSLNLQLSVLLDKYPQEEHNVRKMNETILRMGKMIQGLRDLSRKEADGKIETYGLASAIDALIAVASDKLRSLKINFSVEGDTSITLTGHQVQLSQVLLNLVNNSIWAVKDLQEKWIKLSIRQTQNSVQIIVTDSGKGIPVDISEKVMEPFFTTKPPTEGSGLGLSISSTIINKHGGVLYYDPSYVNTRFVIELPATLHSTKGYEHV